MEASEAKETLQQLRERTQAIYKFHKLQEGTAVNWTRSFEECEPFGQIIHCTASNLAVTKKRPFGRWPYLIQSLGRGSVDKKGVQFIVWDYKFPRYAEINNKFPLLKGMPSDIVFFGDDLAFWHAGWVNRWCYGIEVRNCGPLVRSQSRSSSAFLWAHRYRYRGRQPIKVGRFYWEPYTRQQIESVLWIGRLMAAIHPIRPEWLLGHCHVSSTRDCDPGFHFPIHEVRQYTLDPEYASVPINEIEFLKEFGCHNSRTFLPSEEDPLVSELSLHARMYRNDWDGTPPYGACFPDVESELLGDVGRLKRDLRSLGYYPGPTDDNLVTEAYTETVRAFRGRWKKKRSYRWRNELAVHGRMDDLARLKLEQMLQSRM